MRQIQLVSDQLDDQLNNKHRTEQHPYVVDLRSQQAELQKKLDAAKARVAAGQPPPANVTAPEKSPLGRDSTLADAQAVDLQIQSLEAERDTLVTDIRELTAQRDAMQKQVDGVLPVRQAYEKLTGQLEAARKEHQEIATAAAQFDRTFASDAPLATAVVNVMKPAFTADSGAAVLPANPARVCILRRRRSFRRVGDDLDFTWHGWRLALS